MELFRLLSASKCHPSGGENYQESPYKGHQVHPREHHFLENTIGLIHNVLSFAAQLRGRPARCFFLPQKCECRGRRCGKARQRRRLNQGLRWMAERRGKNCTKTSRVSSPSGRRVCKLPLIYKFCSCVSLPSLRGVYIPPPIKLVCSKTLLRSLVQQHSEPIHPSIHPCQAPFPSPLPLEVVPGTSV